LRRLFFLGVLVVASLISNGVYRAIDTFKFLFAPDDGLAEFL
jgi:hypothetical protein